MNWMKQSKFAAFRILELYGSLESKCSGNCVVSKAFNVSENVFELRMKMLEISSFLQNMLSLELLIVWNDLDVGYLLVVRS